MYKTFDSVFTEKEINKVLEFHEKFKYSFKSFFRAQGTTSFEKPMLDDFGNQRNSIQNPHLLGFSPSLKNSIEDLLYSDSLYHCLQDFSPHNSFVHYQSMLFDKSTGTSLHQDAWYLDTDPGGSLFGVWIALEDISADDGAFYLIENGPDFKVSYNDYDFSNVTNDIRFKSDFPNAHIHKFLPKKGDIVIWDSNNLHGAFLPKEEGLTRKSITAHFYPNGTKVMNQPVERVFSIYNHENPKKTINKNIYTAGTVHPFIYNFICASMFFLGRYSNLFTNDLNNNKDISQIRKL